MLTAETKRRIDACRDVLVGKLPQPFNQVELITLALIYKFMDDLDEEPVKLGGQRSFFVKDLANPPFMTPKGGVTPHTKFRIAAKKPEVPFTDDIAGHLTADGRGGVIVPNGIVATTQNARAKLRRFLVEDSLVAVVSLPAASVRGQSFAFVLRGFVSWWFNHDI